MDPVLAKAFQKAAKPPHLSKYLNLYQCFGSGIIYSESSYEFLEFRIQIQIQIQPILFKKIWRYRPKEIFLFSWSGASKKAVVQEKKFVKKCTVCCLENMESGMLEKMVCKYSQVQGSRAQRKLVVFNLQDVQEKLDQVGVQMDE